MKTKLKNITEIFMGYAFRSKVQSEPDGKYSVIQMKDIHDSNEIDLTDIITVNIDNLKPVYLLNKDDILVKARGNNNTAAIIQDNILNMVASSSLYIVRPLDSNVIPKYLYWYLNNKSSQLHFSSMLSGSTIPMLNKSAIENLEIFIPSIETQEKICEIVSLANREQNIQKQILEKKEKLVEQILINLSKR